MWVSKGQNMRKNISTCISNISSKPVTYPEIFGNTVFSRRFWDRSPKGHNRELWRIIFSYKHVWMAWVGFVYHGNEFNLFYIVNKSYPCHPCMFITKNYSSKFTIMSFWAPTYELYQTLRWGRVHWKLL